MSQTTADITEFALADLCLLASAQLAPPGDRMRTFMATPADDLAALVEAAGGVRGGPLYLALRAMQDLAAQTDRETWEREHTRLFHAAVACPVNETAFIRRDKGAIIGDICGFYRAFGFEPESSTGEKADHLSCELEFAAVLLLMLGGARRADDAGKIDVARAGLQGFLRDHLGEWLGLFCARLAATTELPLFGGAVEVFAGTWDLLARHLDLPQFESLNAEPEAIEEDASTPYECDMAAAERAEPFVELTGPPETGLPQAH